MSHKVADSMDPSALPIAVAARMLSRTGGRLITDEQLRADIDAGAPTNPDGTIHLVHFAAWNVSQLAGRTDAD